MSPAIRIGHTDAHATRATPVTSAQVWKARLRAARYWAAGRQWRQRWKRLLTWSWAERKRCACRADLKRCIWRSRRRVGRCETLWGGRRAGAPSPPDHADGGPDDDAERPRPMRRRPRAREHADRSHRDEPVELARRGHRPGPRAPPAEEARGGRGGPAAAAGALAGPS